MTIDWWTLGFQTVNVLILMWLLARFFWRPLAAVIEKRREVAAQTLSQAEAKRTEAATALAAIETTRAGFAAERASVLAEAKTAAEQLRAGILAEAREAADGLKEAAKAALAKEAEATRTAWSQAAGDLAIDMAMRLVGRLDEATLREAFLESLIAEIAHLPAPARENLIADAAHLTLVGAGTLRPEEQDRCRARLAEVIGHSPELAFETDPGLIAGLELNGAHLVVENSWRSDLARIRAELGR